MKLMQPNVSMVWMVGKVKGSEGFLNQGSSTKILDCGSYQEPEYIFLKVKKGGEKGCVLRFCQGRQQETAHTAPERWYARKCRPKVRVLDDA